MLGVNLCATYAVDPREFVEIFVAFSINNLNGTDPTESTLDDFERKELTNYKSSGYGKDNAASPMQSNVTAFYDEIGSGGENDDVMDAYICTTPKVVYLK